MRRALPGPLLFALVAACSTSEVSGLDGGGAPDTGVIACVTDEACPIDQHCGDKAVCVPGTGNECTATSSTACGAGERCEVVTCGVSRCHGNRCVPRLCGAHADCTGWVCFGGMCQEPPPCGRMTDPACPTGTICEEMRCVADDRTPCRDDQECLEPAEICIKGFCGPEQRCTTSAECAADLRCIRDACRDPCTRAADCGPGPRFTCDMMTGECHTRCLGDNTCDRGFICENNSCEEAECSQDEECVDPMVTQRCEGGMEGHGRCVTNIACTPGGPNVCPPNQGCEVDHCVELPRCIGDRGCEGATYCQDEHCQPTTDCSMGAPCSGDLVCIGGRCVPAICRGPADCPTQGEICIGGECQAPPPVTGVTEVRILTPGGVIRPGATKTFVAVALNQAGQVVPGVTFGWTSSAPAVASIAATGIATGGATAGQTMITASVSTGGGTVSSAPVTLSNLGSVTQGDLRVTVISLATGQPIAGATVVVSTSTSGAGNRITATSSSGVATFSGVQPTAVRSVTALHMAYDYVSVVGAVGTDVMIQLPPRTLPDQAAGVRGQVDLSQVSTEGALSFSLSGASFGSPLFALHPLALFGGDIFSVEVMGQRVPVPAAATVGVDFQGFPISVKETYYARALPGVRAAFSFGGKVGLDTVLGGGGGGGGGIGDILGNLLPYFQRYDHAVRPVVALASIPTVVDTMDIDGDSDTMERVPDWNAFPEVPLRPNTAQTLRYFLSMPSGAAPSGALLVVAGTILPAVGFVPLGLDGLQVRSGDPFPSFVSRMAPAHGGLEIGEYAIVAMAISLGGGLPRPGTNRVLISNALPATVDFSDGFMDRPGAATLRTSVRSVELPAGPAAADLLHLELRGPDGGWHLYVERTSATLALPEIPANAIDRAQATVALVDAIDLNAGLRIGAIFDVAGGGMAALDRSMRAYARGEVEVR